MEDAIKFGEMTGVQRLLMAHHDPTHTDSILNEQFATLQNNMGEFQVKYELAKEGLEIKLK